MLQSVHMHIIIIWKMFLGNEEKTCGHWNHGQWLKKRETKGSLEAKKKFEEL